MMVCYLLDISSSFLLSPPPLVLHSTSLARVVNPPHTYSNILAYKDKAPKDFTTVKFLGSSRLDQSVYIKQQKYYEMLCDLEPNY